MANRPRKPRADDLRRPSKPAKPSRPHTAPATAADADQDDRRTFPPLLSLKSWFGLADVRAYEVAEAVGIDETTLSNIVRGHRSYKRHHLEDMAAFISTKLDRPVTPSMLLHEPGDPALALAIAEMDPAEVARTLKALEALRGK